MGRHGEEWPGRIGVRYEGLFWRAMTIPSVYARLRADGFDAWCSGSVDHRVNVLASRSALCRRRVLTKAAVSN